MDKKIKEIIKYGIMAPSGDNSQPWRFVVTGSKLKIYNLPEKDNPYLNFMQSGSLVAHGALLKNIEITSLKMGLMPEISLFPTNDANLVSEVSFHNDDTERDTSLFEFIPKRATNRRPYENKPISEKDFNILNEVKIFNDLSLHFVNDPESKKRAGAAGSSAEIVILENSLLHEYLFRDVMWSKKQENRERHGLYIKTMEFNPIQKVLFRLAGNKTIMNFAKKIRFPYFIAKQDAVLYSTGATIGLLNLKKISPGNFVELGMAMEEIWLKAASLGLSFQPISATLFLGFKLRSDPADKVLSQEHKKIVYRSYAEIFSAFKLEKSDVPLVMFRIGYAKDPSARSSRKEPVIETTA
ncbi:MAG: hypothetical protein WD991_01435 [Candidatus Paceibacterota bacterium]